MHVSKIHHHESDEPAADGSVEWVYDFDQVVFEEGAEKLEFRCYSDEPRRAVLSPIPWRQVAMLASGLLGDAFRYLHAELGVLEVSAYHPGLGYFRPYLDAVASAHALGQVAPDEAESLVRAHSASWP